MQAAPADSSVGFLDGHGTVELCGGNGLHRLTAQSVSLTDTGPSSFAAATVCIG